MNNELFKNFRFTTAQMNNLLGELKTQKSNGLIRAKFQELNRELKPLWQQVLDEISLSFTGMNLPETKEIARKYLEVIDQSYYVVCLNFQSTTLNPEKRKNLGAWYADLLNRESYEIAKQQKDISYNPKKRTVDEMALVFAFHLNEYRIRINEKLAKVEGLKDEPEQIPETLLQPKKIKWLGNASHLGYIIYQLAEKGFIEFPVYHGEINFTGLAERVLNAFEFSANTPNKKYLSEQINPESDNNKLSDTTRQKLNIEIANLSDLS